MSKSREMSNPHVVAWLWSVTPDPLVGTEHAQRTLSALSKWACAVRSYYLSKALSTRLFLTNGKWCEVHLSAWRFWGKYKNQGSCTESDPAGEDCFVTVRYLEDATYRMLPRGCYKEDTTLMMLSRGGMFWVGNVPTLYILDERIFPEAW